MIDRNNDFDEIMFVHPIGPHVIYNIIAYNIAERDILYAINGGACIVYCML